MAGNKNAIKKNDKVAQNVKRRKTSAVPKKPELPEINEIDVIDLAREVQSRDPTRSNIIKTLEANYQEYPDIVQRLMLQLLFKRVGLGAISYLLTETTSIDKLDLPLFLKKNLYEKINTRSSSIENLDQRIPEHKTFLLHFKKFFEIFFSTQCEILQEDNTMFNLLGNWLVELLQCKIWIIRSQSISVCDIMLKCCADWLEHLITMKNKFLQTQQMVQDSQQSDISKYDNIIIKIENFMNEFFDQVKMRQQDINADIRLKAVQIVFEFMRTLPQLFIQQNTMEETLEFLGSNDTRIKLEVCKQLMDTISTLCQSPHNVEEYKNEFRNSLVKIKQQILINLELRNPKIIQDIIKLLNEIQNLNPQFLTQKETLAIFQVGFELEEPSRHEMALLAKSFFSEFQSIEDLTSQNFTFEVKEFNFITHFQSEQNHESLQEQITILINDIVLKSKRFSQNDQLLQKLVQRLHLYKYSLVYAFPVFFNMMTTQTFQQHNKQIKKSNQFQVILMKIAFFSIEEVMKLSKNSEKMKFIHNLVFPKSLISTSFEIFNRTKDIQQEEQMSLFLSFFACFPIDQMDNEFKQVLFQVLQMADYFFNLSNNPLVIQRISNVYGHLLCINNPYLTPMIHESINSNNKTLKNSIQDISKQINDQITQESSQPNLAGFHSKFFQILVKSLNFFDKQPDQPLDSTFISDLWETTSQLHQFSDENILKYHSLYTMNKILFQQYRFQFKKNVQNLQLNPKAQFTPDFQLISNALQTDCSFFLKEPKPLFQLFKQDALGLLDLYLYHLTEWSMLGGQEQISDSVISYIKIFSPTSPIYEQIKDLPTKILNPKILQIFITLIKLLNEQNQLQGWEHDLALCFYNSGSNQIVKNNFESIKKLNSKFWILLKKKEVENKDQQWFWSVVKLVLENLLEKGEKLQAVNFVQMIKKIYFGDKNKENEEIWKQKFQIFLLQSIDDFIKDKQFFVGFAFLSALLEDKFFDKKTYQRLFAYLTQKVESRKQFLLQIQEPVKIEEEKDFKNVQFFTDRLMNLAGYKKIEKQKMEDENQTEANDKENFRGNLNDHAEMDLKKGDELFSNSKLNIDQEIEEEEDIVIPSHLQLKKSNLKQSTVKNDKKRSLEFIDKKTSSKRLI